RPGHEPSAELSRSVSDIIAERLGKPLKPELVRFVSQLPKTRNAKILRRVIRAAYLGKEDLGDLSSLENPASVDEVRAAAG
ncbi:MAG: AMP-dependent synthetase, partial [Actinobacteria bacterium]|nr:AMP-dependent synthetase [Actinomycetota bacterium]